MATIERWFSHFDIATLLIGAVVGAVFGMFLSTWHSYYVTRPNFVRHGNGGGGGQIKTVSLLFTNFPRFIGLRLSPTTLFGKQIHGLLSLGMVVDVLPARQLRANLYDVETGEHVAELFWQRGQKYEAMIDLASGEQVGLVTFSRHESDATHYYPFRPAADGTFPQTILSDGCFDQAKKFEIRIQHLQARKPMVIPIRVFRRFTGGLWVETPNSGSLL